MFPLPTNEEMLAEIKLCKESNELSDKLFKMLLNLANRFVNLKKFDSFTEDWKDRVMEHIMDVLKSTWHHFNPEKSDKPIPFYLVVISCAYSELVFKKAERSTVS